MKNFISLIEQIYYIYLSTFLAPDDIVALTSEDYLLGLEKEIMGSDYYKILEINKREAIRKDNTGFLENIDEINNRITKVEDNINKINKEQKKQKNYILFGILLNLILNIILMLIII